MVLLYEFYLGVGGGISAVKGTWKNQTKPVGVEEVGDRGKLWLSPPWTPWAGLPGVHTQGFMKPWNWKPGNLNLGTTDGFFLHLLFYLFIYLFIYYFRLHWVFVAAHGPSLVAVSGGYSSLWCAGFSLRWLLLLWSTGSRRAGFSSCGTRALDRRLSSCGARA